MSERGRAWFGRCLALALALTAAEARAQGAGRPGWTLAWSDEFDGDRIDQAKWDFDLGDGFLALDGKTWIPGWGNDELQYYTKEPANAFVRDGLLHIRALKEESHGRHYTSARLKSRKADGSRLFARAYGRFEFRAKLPLGRGMWPALWMLPQDEAYGGWPRSGEIDVMEARGQEPYKVLGTLHYGSAWPTSAHSTKEYALPGGSSIDQFHDYGLEWAPGEIAWTVDGKAYAKQTSWWSSPKVGPDGRGIRASKPDELSAWPAPFDKPFYLIMNLAVGGRFLGDPDASTPFPAEMLVDHVRVYAKDGGDGPLRPRTGENLPFKAP